MNGKVFVLWVFWGAMVAAIFFYQFALGHGIPLGANARTQEFQLPVDLALAQIAIAAVLRWVVVPRVSEPAALLPLLVVGLVLSEAVEFYGIFLVPGDMAATKLVFFIGSLLSALQFIPVYASPKPASPFHANDISG
jgi:hypothetical protein